jgi:hypothetical protein
MNLIDSQNNLRKNILIIVFAIFFTFLSLSTNLTMYLSQSRVVSELLPAIAFTIFFIFFMRLNKVIFLDFFYLFFAYAIFLYIFIYSISKDYQEPLRLIYLAKYIIILAVFSLRFSSRDEVIDWITFVFKFLLILLSFYSLFSIAHILLGFDFSWAEQFGRGSGGQVGTISYAATLIMALPLAIFFLPNKIFFYIIFIILITGIVASGGRAAFIGLLIYLIIAGPYIFPWLNRRVLKLLPLVLVVGLGFTSDRIFRIFASATGGDLQRLDNYLNFFDLSRGWDLIFGFGVGQSSPGIKHLAGLTFRGYESYILNILGEIGLVAGFLMAVLVFLRIINLAKYHPFFISFFSAQIPVFFLQIAHENFTVLLLFSFIIILLTCLPTKLLNKVYTDGL